MNHKVFDYESSDALTRFSARKRPVKAKRRCVNRVRPADMVSECSGYIVL